MSSEKAQYINTLRQSINDSTIRMTLDEIIKHQCYSRKIIESICFDCQFIIKIIFYLILREGNNLVETTKLQLQIKRAFTLLSSKPKANYDVKRLQRIFLFQIFLISQIVDRIGNNLKLSDIKQMKPETIFIILIYLSTDKLVSPVCFKLVHDQLRIKNFPFGQQRRGQASKNKQEVKEVAGRTQIESFKEEVRSIIHPKIEQKQRIKHSHSVGLMISRFNNKENISHTKMNKALRQGTHSSQSHLFRPRKCFSQNGANPKESQLQMDQECQRNYNWSKCELMKTNYVPFCTVKTSTPKKSKLVINSYLKFKKIKQRTIQFHLKHRELILKL